MKTRKLTKQELSKMRRVVSISRKNYALDFKDETTKFPNGFTLTAFSSKKINAFYLLSLIGKAFPTVQDLGKIIDDIPSYHKGIVIVKVKNKESGSTYYSLKSDDTKQSLLILIMKAFYAKKSNIPNEDPLAIAMAKAESVDIIEINDSDDFNSLYFWMGQNNKLDKYQTTPEERLKILNSIEYQRGLLLAGGITPWISMKLITQGIKPAGYSSLQLKKLYGIDIYPAKEDISEIIEELKLEYSKEQIRIFNSMSGNK